MKLFLSRYQCKHADACVVLFIVLTISACTKQPIYQPPTVSGSEISVDISSLKPDVPQFYTYQYHGKNINFFVLKLDRKVLSFLDACASCYPHKQGYRYEDGAVTCRSCNMRFSLYKLEKGLGGCYPIKIEGRTEKDTYRIPLAVLENAADKF